MENDKNEMKKKPGKVLPWLAAVLLAGAITLLALWCQPNALRSVLAVFRGQRGRRCPCPRACLRRSGTSAHS